MKRLVLVCAPLLAACNTGGPEFASNEGGAAINVGSSGQRYECDTGSTIFAKTSGRVVDVALEDGTTLRLARVQTAGRTVTYAADGWVWFTDEDRAVLTEQGGQKNCRVSAL